MERGAAHLPIGPVFIGGTGRCGTHAVAYLAAQSDRFALIPAELRVHVSERGLPRFASGERSRGWLLRGLRTHWWRHRPEWDPVAVRGVHTLTSRRRYLTALAHLAVTPPGADRVAISRRLLSSLLNPLAPAPGAWIEKSPDNCARAGLLDSIFPRLRLIHVVRDGRDVACSFMRVPWAPDDFAGALAVWERRLLDAHRGTLELPAGQVHRVRLEDLTLHDRDRSYGALVAFLGIADAPALRFFFDRELTPWRARIGRWLSDLPRAEHERAQDLYRASLRRLDQAGVWPLPADPALPAEPPAVAELPLRSHSPSQIDPWASRTAAA